MHLAVVKYLYGKWKFVNRELFRQAGKGVIKSKRKG